MNRLLICLFSCSLSVSLPSFASDSFSNSQPPQMPSNGHPPSFSDFDSNGDGVLTEDEVQGPMRNDFSQIDANGDGQVTEQEMDTFMRNHKPPQGRGGHDQNSDED
ncbi:EF-hand domain-containing protein [Vibrio tritonius]|uniref:EF-hand domain-containing protein n=1 Tax=Vibrio tritonius TaxID=1435069 RepID=UPI000AF2BB59|nr:EF-hand domain-containing protein [Vibrio tritonius]